MENEIKMQENKNKIKFEKVFFCEKTIKINK